MTALLQGNWNDILNSRVKEYTQRDACYSYSMKDGASPYGLDTVIGGDRFEVNEREMSIRFPYADGNRRDGVGDLLEVTGIDLERHRKNPTVLFDHGKEVKLPVAKAEHPETKEYSVFIDGLAKTADVKAYFYQGKDHNDKTQHGLFCEQLFDLMAKGYVRGGSIGYQVLQAKQMQPDYERGTPQGLHLLKVLQLEASAVVMPANMDTVRKALDLKTVCGKPLSPYLVKSLQCYVPEKKVQLGYEGRKKALQYPDGTVPKIGDRVRVDNVEGVLVRDYPATSGGASPSARLRKDDGTEVDVSGLFADKINGEHLVGTKAQRDLSKTDVPPARWKPGVGAVKHLRRKYSAKGYASSILGGAVRGSARGALIGGAGGAALGVGAAGVGAARAAREGREYHMTGSDVAGSVGALASFGAAFGGVGGAVRGALHGYREERDRRKESAKSIQMDDFSRRELETEFVETLRDDLHAAGVEGFAFQGDSAHQMTGAGPWFGVVVALPERTSTSEAGIDEVIQRLQGLGYKVTRTKRERGRQWISVVKILDLRGQKGWRAGAAIGGVVGGPVGAAVGAAIGHAPTRQFLKRRAGQSLRIPGVYNPDKKKGYGDDSFRKGERVVLASPNLSSGGTPYNAGDTGTVVADSQGTVYLRMDDGEYVTAMQRDVHKADSRLLTSKGYVSSALQGAALGAGLGGALVGGTAAASPYRSMNHSLVSTGIGAVAGGVGGAVTGLAAEYARRNADRLDREYEEMLREDDPRIDRHDPPSRKKGYVSSILRGVGEGAATLGPIAALGGAMAGGQMGNVNIDPTTGATPGTVVRDVGRNFGTGMVYGGILGTVAGGIGGGIAGAIHEYRDRRALAESERLHAEAMQERADKRRATIAARKKGMPNQQTAINMARDGAWDVLEDYLKEEVDGNDQAINRFIDELRATNNPTMAPTWIQRHWHTLTDTNAVTRRVPMEMEPKEPIDWGHVAREIGSILGMVLLPIGTFAAGYGIAYVTNKVAELFERKGRKLSQREKDNIAQVVEGEVKRRRQKALTDAQTKSLTTLPSIGLKALTLPSLAETYQKSLDLRKKYTAPDAKGFVRRLKKSRPGMSVIYVHPKDLAHVRRHCQQLDVKFHHSKSAGDDERVTLTGHDPDVDEIAKRWGRPVAPRRMNAQTKSKRR